MSIGILGGTGPAGRGLATRLAAAGERVVIGSRDADRAAGCAEGILERWPERSLRLSGSDNATAAGSDIVVVATPWDAALPTVRGLAGALEGKVVLSMVVGLVRDGREFLGLLTPRGSMAAALQHALPGSLVSAALHHLPASELEDLASQLDADVLVCSDHPRATEATASLVSAVDGLRPVDAGSLSQAAAIEAFTAVLTTVNVKHKVHTSLRLAGYGEGRR
ncbi:MAG TPA: NADPH-dependent F420 reductase [Acidimicrobiales bacterium]|nr:NADPH-dependent F420 reductase [Acidimicrobiales bacterium]